MSATPQTGAVEARVAVVTGAASGIGQAVARRLAADGMRVMLVDLSEKVHAIARELPQAEGHALDVANEAAVSAFAQDVLARHGRVDVLVNSAGINRVGKAGPKVESTSIADWEATMGVNLTGPFLFCRAFVGSMKEQGWGRIVNIASRAGRTGVRGSDVPYAASKGGLISLTRTVAIQAAKYGITANCIAPGFVQTPMTEMSDASFQARLAAIPAGRVGTPEEIAGITAFLAGDEAGYITGAVVDANGGGFMG